MAYIRVFVKVTLINAPPSKRTSLLGAASDLTLAYTQADKTERGLFVWQE